MRLLILWGNKTSIVVRYANTLTSNIIITIIRSYFYFWLICINVIIHKFLKFSPKIIHSRHNSMMNNLHLLIIPTFLNKFLRSSNFATSTIITLILILLLILLLKVSNKIILSCIHKFTYVNCNCVYHVCFVRWIILNKKL